MTKVNRKQETKHIVAILDMLGASEMIKGGRSEDIMNFISNTYIDAEKSWPFTENAPKEVRKLKSITFSDNIVFALEIENMQETEILEAVKALTIYVSVFQRALLKNRFLFRGGITIGKLYIDSEENFVWGDALVDAHMLEANEAKYPRVIFSDKFDSALLLELPRVKQDFDGKYFVDYFFKTKDSITDWIIDYDTMMETAHIKYKNNERVLEKYNWIETHINKVMKNINLQISEIENE